MKIVQWVFNKRTEGVGRLLEDINNNIGDIQNNRLSIFERFQSAIELIRNTKNGIYGVLRQNPGSDIAENGIWDDTLQRYIEPGDVAAIREAIPDDFQGGGGFLRQLYDNIIVDLGEVMNNLPDELVLKYLTDLERENAECVSHSEDSLRNVVKEGIYDGIRWLKSKLGNTRAAELLGLRPSDIEDFNYFDELDFFSVEDIHNVPTIDEVLSSYEQNEDIWDEYINDVIEAIDNSRFDYELVIDGEDITGEYFTASDSI